MIAGTLQGVQKSPARAGKPDRQRRWCCSGGRRGADNYQFLAWTARPRMVRKCRLFIGLGEQGTARCGRSWRTIWLKREGFWNWIWFTEDQYETVMRTQGAAGLTCDIVNISGSTNNKDKWIIKHDDYIWLSLERKLVAPYEWYLGQLFRQAQPKRIFTTGFRITEVEKLNVMEDGNIYWLSA